MHTHTLCTHTHTHAHARTHTVMLTRLLLITVGFSHQANDTGVKAKRSKRKRVAEEDGWVAGGSVDGGSIWSCTVCTYENRSLFLVCDMCNAQRFANGTSASTSGGSGGGSSRSHKYPKRARTMAGDDKRHNRVMNDLSKRGYPQFVASVDAYQKSWRTGKAKLATLEEENAGKLVGDMHDLYSLTNAVQHPHFFGTMTWAKYNGVLPRKTGNGVTVEVDRNFFDTMAVGDEWAAVNPKFGIILEKSGSQRPNHWQLCEDLGGDRFKLTDVKRDGTCCIAVLWMLGNK